MLTSRSFVLATLSAVLSAALAAGAFVAAVHAQSDPINPPVAKCNTTPDVMTDASGKIVPTPVTPALLTSGQPCQQKVTTSGLVPNNPLANLQRGFDFYSWLTFIALNSPADGKTIGQGPRPGGDAMTQWESVGNYRPLADVMLANGAKPAWGTRIVPPACQRLDGPGKIVLIVGEEAWNQPFKTGPLIDQNGNYALFDILMNKVMFDFIDTNGLYSKQGQQASKLDPIEFPEGANPNPTATPPKPGVMGAVMVKVSWRILDPVKDAAVMNTFHTADALVFFPGPPHTKAGPTCVEQTLGLIGFHVGHKTAFAPQWVWTSFEHAANVPTESDVKNRNFLSRYSFYNKDCKDNCDVNVTPPDPWDPPATLQFHNDYRSQIVRTETLPPLTDADVKELNTKFHAILKGTVWENYILLTTQWPTDFKNPIDPTGVPAPTYLANTTLETYSQGTVPLASSSCMACHGNATDQHVPAKASDFTFILEKAQPVTASK